MPYARVPVLALAASDYASNELIPTERLLERATFERRRQRPDLEWVFCEAVAIRATMLPNDTREETSPSGEDTNTKARVLGLPKHR